MKTYIFCMLLLISVRFVIAQYDILITKWCMVIMSGLVLIILRRVSNFIMNLLKETDKKSRAF
jgi:ABC-type tungstate transport system substrate-binding protein